jgi:hypothetical protein
MTQLIKKFLLLIVTRKVHYRTQNSPPLSNILCQINQIYCLKYYLFRIHFNIFNQSMAKSPNQSTALVALGGLVVSVIANKPKFRGFKHGRGRWIFNGEPWVKCKHDY